MRKLRIALAVLALLAAAGGALAYFQYQRLSRYLITEFSGQASKTIGRQIKFRAVKFSPLSGIIIKDACVSRVPDFSKGSFFCAEKAVIKPSFTSMLRKQVYFSRVAFYKPVIKLRERGGVWDFADLLALLPKTDKGLYLTWNASELTMEDAVLEADMESSGLSVALEGADLSLTHYSAFGGNYGLTASGQVKSAVKGKLLSSAVNIDADLNFDYGGLASTKGSFSASDASYGAMTLRKLDAGWELFNLRKPTAEKNYSVTASASGLVVPAQESPVRDGVAGALRLFASAMGRPAPEIEDIEVSELNAAFRLNDSLLRLDGLKLRSNFMDLDAGIAIDGPAASAEASLDAAIGNNKIKMSAAGPLASPEIKPVLSATLSAKFKEALDGIEKALLGRFPVVNTGEQHV